MAEELTEETIKLCTKRKLATLQLKNNATINSSDNVKITKILTVVACPNVDNVETFNAETKFNISVRYDALVCLENGEIVTLSQTGVSNSSCENSLITADSNVDVFASVLDVNSSIANGEVNVNSLVSCDIYLSNRNICLKQLSKSDDVFTKDCEVEINSHKISNAHSSIISSEIDAQGKVNKIIFCQYQGCVKSVVAGNDYYTVGGEMVVNLMAEYEDGQLKSLIKSIPFSEEIECKGLCKEDIMQTYFVTNKPCNTNIITDADGNNTISVELPYIVKCDVYQKCNREFVVDAYNVKKEVNLTTESYEQNEFYNSKFVEDKIVSTFTLTEDAPRVERILLSTGESISLVNSYTKNGEIVIEGIANVGTIYYSEDDEGNKVLNSVVIDVPYSLSIIAPEVNEGDNVEVDVKLGEVTVKNKKGRELEVIANINICYSVNKPLVFAVVTELSFGDEKPLKDYALEIYVAKENQTLWDIAKYLNISSDSLLSQNPDVSLPIVAGEKIVAYRGGQE